MPQHSFSENDYHYKVMIEKRWSDIDEARVVNNAKVMTYLEEARIRFFNQQLGWDWNAAGLVVARAEVDYLLPITEPDQPTTYLRCTKVGQKSFTLHSIMAERQGGEWRLFVAASFVLVAFDYKARQSVLLPQAMRQRLAAYAEAHAQA